MKSVAFFNNKGGVGKTTLLCNIASYLAIHKNYKILIIDADPQCNATQLLLDEDIVNELYEDSKSYTIHSIVHPLSIGKGYSEIIRPIEVDNFKLELLAGDPKLALKEDLLSQDWQSSISGDIRGLRTSFVFSELLSRCENYDLVFFDMGPSLGSINRAVLLACDFFLSPMSIDIFSLRAIENIAVALKEWRKRLSNALTQIPDDAIEDLPKQPKFDVQFIGYIAQQYNQKTKQGEKRAVDAYEKIMRRIPIEIQKHLVDTVTKAKIKDFRIGEIPNLYSLIPMSQSEHKPIFDLKAKDGVRGAHFTRVKDAELLFKKVSSNMIKNIEACG
ncbi:ParA family protein [Prosthecomicrobium hirschii]|uniref:ParA family protein n=1 Tax=Prosthecodimorpha hirschii TaxID=665126 RepID=UPI0009FB6804|nr:AAA family ATPase [Prosthecomicrobium hirschii]